MSHCHDEHGHGGGHDHSHHEHDHSDDVTPAIQYSLYEQIHFDHIVTLNEASAGSGRAVVKKTWAERLDPAPELESDVDAQILMTVPFTAQVKLHAILLRTSSSPSAPRTLHLFTNREDMDFAAAEGSKPVQVLELAQTSEVQEIPVRRALFGGVRSLTLFIVDNFGGGGADGIGDDDEEEEVSRVSYVGFKGEWSLLGRAPERIVYEAAAQPGDHKVKGAEVNRMAGGF